MRNLLRSRVCRGSYAISLNACRKVRILTKYHFLVFPSNTFNPIVDAPLTHPHFRACLHTLTTRQSTDSLLIATLIHAVSGHGPLCTMYLLVDRLVHGNTLTSAVVIENIKVANKSISSSGAPCVFLTGPTSKVKPAGSTKVLPPTHF